MKGFVPITGVMRWGVLALDLILLSKQNLMDNQAMDCLNDSYNLAKYALVAWFA